MKTVEIYIDTSLKGPRRRDGWWTYIIAMETSQGTADIGDTGKAENTTENQATLIALETALKRLNKPCYLILHLECEYVANVLTNGWLEQWHYGGWMTKKNKPVADSEKWSAIQYLLNAHQFLVKLKEPHTYREWMQRKLKEKEKEDV